jgi:hypothetical protein
MLNNAILYWKKNRAWCISALFTLLFGVLFCVVLWLLLWLCVTPFPRPEKQPTNQRIVVTEVTARDVEIQNNHIKQIRAALVRALPIDQSCYDETMGLWFVHSTKIATKDNPDETWLEGWYYNPDDELKYEELGNGTYMMTDTNGVFNTEVGPDLSGLNCETHPTYK